MIDTALAYRLVQFDDANARANPVGEGELRRALALTDADSIYGSGIEWHGLQVMFGVHIRRLDEFIASLTTRFHMPPEDAAVSADNLRAAAARCMLERI